MQCRVRRIRFMRVLLLMNIFMFYPVIFRSVRQTDNDLFFFDDIHVLFLFIISSLMLILICSVFR